MAKAGHSALRAATTYLEMRNFEIVELSWRRPRAEIDIVAKKGDVIYFVEVKYNKSNPQSNSLEYITASKLDQMERGAMMWVEENEYGGNYQLAAIETSGSNFTIEHFIDNIG